MFLLLLHRTLSPRTLLARAFSVLRRLCADEKSKLPRVKWFYATDIPIRKPAWFEYKKEKDPEKFIPFSENDSERLEKAFRKYNGKTDKNNSTQSRTVDVNEDRLFKVDLEKFELLPVFWEGPVFEVRRGTWFYRDGIPLSRKLAQKIEDGYQKRKHLLRGRDSDKDNWKLVKEYKQKVQRFNDKSAVQKNEDITDDSDYEDIVDLGDGSLVLYCTDCDAVIFRDDMKTKFNLEVLRNLGPTPASLLSVQKLQRGFTDDLTETILDSLPSNPLPEVSEIFQNEVTKVLDPTSTKPEMLSDETQNRQEKNEIESDYDHNLSQNDAEREIDHLILCVHGIGQVLGSKYESINFTHSVNVMRNTMRSVYESEEEYHKMAYGDKDSSERKRNNRIQVLPISWRHKIDFHPKKALEEVDDEGENRLPALSEINVDGVKPLRNLVGDVALDILLYYDQKYVDQIFKTVTEELNRVYSLYMERNPNFKGKVHIMGHSLGSCIAFDILAAQPEDVDKDKIDTSKHLKFDVENLFCVGSPVGMFKLLGRKNIVPRSAKNSDLVEDLVSPKCERLYNIFHPCDPVGYRMEPLIKSRFAKFKPELVSFAVRGFDRHVKGLAKWSNDIQERIVQASSWLTGTKEALQQAITETETNDENALRQILTSLISNKDTKKPDKEPKKQEKENTKAPVKDLKPEDLELLLKANSRGRVDYCLPMGVFDISLVSAISAHVSYFEDQDTAGFIMKETLSVNEEAPKLKKVIYY